MSLKIDSVPIDSIHLDPANVRSHPERNLATIKASLARFGQQKPIVVDADGIVRAGNGTLEAARALGWEKIDVVRTPLKGSEATAYAIADNRTAELAAWDQTGLAEQLRSLQSEDFDLVAVGYTDDEIGTLIDGLAADLAGDDVIPITEESMSSPSRLLLIWGDNKIPMTDDEADALDRAFKKHQADSGTSYGFVTALVNRV